MKQGSVTQILWVMNTEEDACRIIAKDAPEG